MEPTIYKPGVYNTPGVYKGAGIYKGRGVYNDGGSTPPLQKVIFGGIEYEFVKINNLYWITNSLKNNVSGAYTTPRGVDAGLLYPFSSFTDINALLHDGWRIPERNDFIDLMGSASDVPSGPYLDESEGGTNETKFSALLTGYINQNGNLTRYNERGCMWSNTDYFGTNKYNAYCTISIFGNNDFSNTSTLKLQIRVCKDV